MSPIVQEDPSDLWMYHMRRGAFEEAWKNSDKILEKHAGIPCWHMPRHLQYIWDGTPLDGKRVLVRCYHGLGDTLQFVRYAPLLKSKAKEVIFWAQPPLIPLLKTVSGIDQLLPLHDGSPEVSYDVDVEVMELPHIFRTTLETIPLDIPYIQVTSHILTKREGHKTVGLVWRAGDWDDRRSIPFGCLSQLAALPGIEFYILQGAAISAGWDGMLGIYPGELSLDTYAQTLKGLDLLISVDSMPAHLAGALGVHVWTLLHKEADWRWMDHRSDSPWYPSMRLFRQQEAGDWDTVIDQVQQSLLKLH